VSLAWHSHRTWSASFLAAALLISLPSAVRADALPGAPNGFTNRTAYGDVDLLRGFAPEEDGDCFPGGEVARGRCVLASIEAVWAPRNVPVSVEVRRTAAHGRLVFTSRLLDPRSANPCWQQRVLTRAEMANARRLAATIAEELSRWAAACPVILAFGTERTLAAFEDVRGDFLRALVAVRRERAPLLSDQTARTWSFLPSEIDQPALDAVAVACGGESAGPQLALDRTFAWRFDMSEPQPEDAILTTKPFGLCVHDQVRNFPGFRES